jgi:hypothetical protein
MLAPIAYRIIRSLHYRATKLFRAEAVSPAAEEDPAVPGVLLNTLPKSGSVFLFHTLSRSLQCGRMHVGNMYSLVDQIGLERMRRFVGGGYISQNHLAPSPENLQILEHFRCPVVLHLRDPRQALVSWTHHADSVYRRQGEEALLLFPRRPPAAYFSWDLTQKLDWQIDHYWPVLIDWLERWLDVHDAARFPVLLTTYGELCGDIVGLCRRICDFCGVAADRFRFVELPKTDEYHYRLADDGEWLRVLSAGQIDRVNRTLPPEIAYRLGWPHPTAPATADRFDPGFPTPPCPSAIAPINNRYFEHRSASP